MKIRTLTVIGIYLEGNPARRVVHLRETDGGRHASTMHLRGIAGAELELGDEVEVTVKEIGT